MSNIVPKPVLRKALYKEFQELTEALGDLSAMMTKEEGILMKDDYSNLERLKTLLEPDVTREPQEGKWSQECTGA